MLGSGLDLDMMLIKCLAKGSLLSFVQPVHNLASTYRQDGKTTLFSETCFLTFNRLHLSIISRYKYRRSLNPDGNFTAQHMKMRRPDLDVPLTDGEGFTAKVGPYEAHLESTIDKKEVCASLVFRSLLQVLTLHRNVHATTTRLFHKQTLIKKTWMQLE